MQSDVISFSGAAVSVTANGEQLPVQVAVLLPDYGSSHAISIIPEGWVSEAGNIYQVKISNIASPIEYSVEVVNCAEVAAEP